MSQLELSLRRSNGFNFQTWLHFLGGWSKMRLNRAELEIYEKSLMLRVSQLFSIKIIFREKHFDFLWCAISYIIFDISAFKCSE